MRGRVAAAPAASSSGRPSKRALRHIHIPALECSHKAWKMSNGSVGRRGPDANMTMIRRFRAGLLFKGKGKAYNAVAHNFRFHSPTIRANEKGLGNPKIFPVSTIFII